jgi:hypothetical protein
MWMQGFWRTLIVYAIILGLIVLGIGILIGKVM